MAEDSLRGQQVSYTCCGHLRMPFYISPRSISLMCPSNSTLLSQSRKNSVCIFFFIYSLFFCFFGAAPEASVDEAAKSARTQPNVLKQM